MEYILIIQSTDSGSPPLSIKKNVTVAITNVNQPPTDIIIDSEKVKLIIESDKDLEQKNLGGI